MLKKNRIGLLLLWLIPIIVFAEELDQTLQVAFIWEAVSSFHVTLFFLMPLRVFLNRKGIEIPIWKLFIIRVVLLLIITPFFPSIAFVEVGLMFIGPLLSGGKINMGQPKPITETPKGILICPKCGAEISYGNKKCPSCGESLKDAKYICPKCHIENQRQSKFCKSCGNPLFGVGGSNPTDGVECPHCHELLLEPMKFCKFCGKDVEQETVNIQRRANTGTPFSTSQFDPVYMHATESMIIQKVISKELDKNQSLKGKTLPYIERRKMIMTIIYVVITFIITTLYVAYHTYVVLDISIWLVATGVFIYMTYKYNIRKYIEKEVKKRPDEKISYIISSVLSSATPGGYFTIFIQIGLITALLVGIFFLYKEPHMIFERQANGYHVRYYTIGIVKNEKKITIPKKYKNKPVVGIRGDVFKNVRTVEIINLPSTIEEIRGGAFQNCVNLKSINLPMGIDEIHGSTFEGCRSLESIMIPEGVMRIGGSAFRDCYSLKEATIPRTVAEIGSSAFRNTGLSEVCISRSTDVNERAFKGTSTKIAYYENDCEYVYGGYKFNDLDY